MPMTLKLQDAAGADLFDLSPSIRMQDDAGFDPAPGFEEGSFLQAPLAEGNPFLGIDEKNREMVVPVWLNDKVPKVPRTYRNQCPSPNAGDLSQFQEQNGPNGPSTTWALGTHDMSLGVVPAIHHVDTLSAVGHYIATATGGSPVTPTRSFPRLPGRDWPTSPSNAAPAAAGSPICIRAAHGRGAPEPGRLWMPPVPATRLPAASSRGLSRTET